MFSCCFTSLGKFLFDFLLQFIYFRCLFLGLFLGLGRASILHKTDNRKFVSSSRSMEITDFFAGKCLNPTLHLFRERKKQGLAHKKLITPLTWMISSLFFFLHKGHLETNYYWLKSFLIRSFVLLGANLEMEKCIFLFYFLFFYFMFLHPMQKAINLEIYFFVGKIGISATNLWRLRRESIQNHE